jgi:hypothetical protein
MNHKVNILPGISKFTPGGGYIGLTVLKRSLGC